ncbi:hypothetical protein RS9916_33927 [Synechococcus sp. RS9916]|nr:hypothetical protein RS9916_33927 [Synechococcus sp. RS9916]
MSLSPSIGTIVQGELKISQMRIEMVFQALLVLLAATFRI